MAPSRTRYDWLLLLLLLLLLVFSFSAAASGNDSEASSLLKFRQSLSNPAALSNWNEDTPLCSGNDSNWKGLLCMKGVFYGLQLESMGLGGKIDVEALAELPNLRTMSLMNNRFEGPMPDLRKVGGLLLGLYLSGNSFSGDIPGDAFAGMKLRKLYLANNQFVGKIPESIAKLGKLVDLQLNNNRFEGNIPDFSSKQLSTVNLANNRLEGRIPASLSKMSPSSFSGNLDLCGEPSSTPCKSSKKPVKKIAIIAAAVAAVALAAICLAFTFRRRQAQKKAQLQKGTSAELNDFKKEFAHKQQMEQQRQLQQHGKLYFVRSNTEKFELQDLLRASAEVLGSSGFGSSYKATLLTGEATIVVKRFRHMSSIGKEDLHEHMRRLGRLSHPNLLPLVAFYYKKEEKLFISDFVENGSLASHLHGKRNPDQPGLNWPTRLKIIKGVARGLAYLYKELSTLTLPHGHLKSSNVLVDDSSEPLLADYALAPVMDKQHAQQFMVAYKSPEFTEHDRTTKKTDVWSLGILILEMLTGKFPANYLRQDKGVNADLAAWVNSVVREEWTGEVFDKDMKRTKNCEGEMLKLLKIGMCCCEWNAERRWNVWEAVEKIEELKERDVEEDYSSYASEGEYLNSSRAMNSEEDFSFSVTG